jgi:hypothetical protein
VWSWHNGAFKRMLLSMTWLSRISILISFWQTTFDCDHLKLFSKQCVNKTLRRPPSKTLCRKLIKIDKLPSRVKLNKMSMFTHMSKLFLNDDFCFNNKIDPKPNYDILAKIHTNLRTKVNPTRLYIQHPNYWCSFLEKLSKKIASNVVFLFNWQPWSPS